MRKLRARCWNSAWAYALFGLVCVGANTPTICAQRPDALPAPTGLHTELLEHTDRVWLDGRPSTVRVDEVETVIERWQCAEIRAEKPAFGWFLPPTERPIAQKAYRILVASSPTLLREGRADVWDSGRQESANSVSAPYGGAPLQPNTTYYWTVRLWTAAGDTTSYAVPKLFRTAAQLDNKTSHYPLEKLDEYPVRSEEVDGGAVFDFGRDAFGRLRLTLTTLEPHDTLVLHLGERTRQGRVDRTPGGSIRYSRYVLPLLAGTHTYVVKIRPDRRNTALGANESGVNPILMPPYVGEVTPFRYVEVEGRPAVVQGTDLVRETVHYPFNEAAAVFHSSDSVLNQIWELCRYSVKATSFCGTYVDGDRERIPYEADALINQWAHYAVDCDYSLARLTTEHLIFFPTWPTEWIMQTVQMAWNDYLYSGNAALLKSYYNDLQAKSLWALQGANGLISTAEGRVTPAVKTSIHFNGPSLRDIVDWPATGAAGIEKECEGERDGFEFTPYNAVVNAYHYEALRLLSLMAEALGLSNEARQWAHRAEQVKRQYNRLLFDAQRGVYVDGVGSRHASLHANMFALAFHLVPEARQAGVVRFVSSRGMACSVYGAQFLLDGLFDAGAAPYALSLLRSTGRRSWYNMLRSGSTITTEAWDDVFKPNQDWNHAWGAAAGNVITRKLMGVEPVEAGFRRIRIRPALGDLEEALLQMPTVRGPLRMQVENRADAPFQLVVQVPVGAEAEVWLPLQQKQAVVGVDGTTRVLKQNRTGFAVVEVGSGNHQFVVRR